MPSLCFPQALKAPQTTVNEKTTETLITMKRIIQELERAFGKQVFQSARVHHSTGTVEARLKPSKLPRSQTTSRVSRTAPKQARERANLRWSSKVLAAEEKRQKVKANAL